MKEYLLLELSIALITDVKIFAKLFLYFRNKGMVRCAAVMMLMCGLWCQLFYRVNDKRLHLTVLREWAA